MGDTYLLTGPQSFSTFFRTALCQGLGVGEVYPSSQVGLYDMILSLVSTGDTRMAIWYPPYPTPPHTHCLSNLLTQEPKTGMERIENCSSWVPLMATPELWCWGPRVAHIPPLPLIKSFFCLNYLELVSVTSCYGLNCVPQTDMLKSLTSRTSEVNLFGDRVMADVTP